MNKTHTTKRDGRPRGAVMNSYEEFKIVFTEVTFRWNFEGCGVVQQAAKAKNRILGRRNNTGRIQVCEVICVCISLIASRKTQIKEFRKSLVNRRLTKV